MIKTITLKLTPELRARLEKYCQIHDRSASWVIKNIIETRSLGMPYIDLKKFKGVSEKLTVSIPENQAEGLFSILYIYSFKLQDFLRTEIYLLTKGRKYK
jgi:hypothetical protein